MTEANPIKYYVAKYSLLLFAVIQWCVGGVLLLYDELNLATIVIVSFFLIFGSFLLVLFTVVNNKVRRVVVGDRKIVVLEESTYLRVELPQVKSLHIFPVINLCKLKVRGKKGSIYFFLTGNIRATVESMMKQISGRNVNTIDIKQS